MPNEIMGSNSDDIAIQNFRTYLRIPSVQPDVDYTDCVTFLKQQAEEIGLECAVYEFVPKEPVILMTLRGTKPSLGSIVLNSHMDVVTVSVDDWHHDPFGAEMDKDGNIYARGAQDTKELGIQYLEAIRRLLKSGQKFLRNIHVSFVPDEEVGGEPGMAHLVESDEFKALNVAFTLDEGGPYPGPEFLVYNGEKATWHVTFHVRGTEGHGSLDLRNTAGEKLRVLLDQVMDYRQNQLNKIDADPSVTVGDVTFLNLTEIQGGDEPNVVPSTLSVTLDIRVAVTDDEDKLTLLLEEWANKAGDGITIEYSLKDSVSPVTPIDETNPFWAAMKQIFDRLGQKIKIGIAGFGTDGRFLRRKGVNVISFSPINNTPPLAHANDEFLNKEVFLRGIDIFTEIIPSIANIPSDE